MAVRSIPEPCLEPHTLQRLVQQLADRPAFWKPHVAYQSPRRYWSKLVTRADLDVWLLTWLYDQGTQFHDHGSSQAAFVVVAGELTETRPSPLGGDFLRQRLTTGQSHTVEQYAIHDVHNASQSPAISIHAYSPPLRTMTFYESAVDGLIATYREELLSSTRARLRRVDSHNTRHLHKDGATLVDIRPIHQRVEYGEIPGSIIIERNVSEWRFDPHGRARLPHIEGGDQPVVVFCQQGYASSLAAASLQDLGLRQATDLIGGFEAWRIAGLPTVAGGTPSGLWVTPRPTQR